MNSEMDMVLAIDQTAIDSQYPTTNQLRKISSDAIFRSIDRLSSELGPTPSIGEQWFSVDKRERARVNEEAKIEAVSARMILIRGLKEHLHIYLKAHESELNIRTKALETESIVITEVQVAETKGKATERITETFDHILTNLAQQNEKVISSYYDLYLESVDSIMEKKNMPEDMRKAAIASAKERLTFRLAQDQKSNNRTMENLRELVNRYNCETGMC